MCSTPKIQVSILFKLGEDIVVCQTCVLAFKAVLSVVADKSALRPFSTCIKSFLSSQKEEASKMELQTNVLASSIDVAPLALLLAVPCTQKHEKGPLWAACSACHARRCIRLLDSLEPALNAPRFIRRRARLAQFQDIADFDPRFSLRRVGPFRLL